MADEPTDNTDEQPDEPTSQAAETPAVEAPTEPQSTESADEPATEESSAEEPATEEPSAEEPATYEPVADETDTDEPVAQEADTDEPVAQESAADEPVAKDTATDESMSDEPVSDDVEDEDEEPTPRVKPTVPGAHLEVDIVPEGVDPLAPDQPVDPYAVEDDDEPQAEEEQESGRLSEPISTAAIDLAAGARYNATGKRKTAIARVILRPGTGAYLVNGRALDEHFPRITLQRNIRQPLETVGYQDRMDVVARLQGGGISAQAGALRHGISRALLEADPNLRGELKRRGFLTRDSRAKERKKAGLKKARKRPQFSKR
jgi:small subunit ribosomal protein S9